MTTLYKIAGVFMSWDDAHNLGYTMHATAIQTYKSAYEETWGEYAGTGYYDEDTETHMMENSMFFITGFSGWSSLDNLAIEKGCYPSQAEELVMHNINTGIVSNAAKLVDGAWTRYLIQKALSNGWFIEEELPDYGWEEGTGSAPYCGNIATGDTIYLDSVGGGGGDIAKHPIPLKPLKPLISWSAGGNLNNMYILGGEVTSIADNWTVAWQSVNGAMPKDS